jgi:hypothetical protein
LQHWLELGKAQAKLSGSLFIKANAEKKLISDLDEQTRLRERVPFQQLDAFIASQILKSLSPFSLQHHFIGD